MKKTVENKTPNLDRQIVEIIMHMELPCHITWSKTGWYIKLTDGQYRWIASLVEIQPPYSYYEALYSSLKKQIIEREKDQNMRELIKKEIETFASEYIIKTDPNDPQKILVYVLCKDNNSYEKMCQEGTIGLMELENQYYKPGSVLPRCFRPNEFDIYKEMSSELKGYK